LVFSRRSQQMASPLLYACEQNYFLIAYVLIDYGVSVRLSLLFLSQVLNCVSPFLPCLLVGRRLICVLDWR
jgi:hypothetical protein